MPLEAPERSELGFYVRSLLEARGGIGQQPTPPPKPEPYPIPGRQTYCLAGYQNRNEPAPDPDNRCGPATNPCPTEDPGSLEGDWISDYFSEEHCVPNQLVPRNFPVRNGSDSFEAGCLDYWMGGNTYPQVNILRTLSFDEVGGVTGRTRFLSCSNGDLGQGAPDSFISLSMATARWSIVSIDGSLNRIYLSAKTYLYTTGPGGIIPTISISGQPKNNGYYGVFRVDDDAGWIEVFGGLENEAGFGLVSFQPGIATVCGVCTSIIDACQSVRIYVNSVAGVDPRMHLFFTDGPYADEGPMPIPGIGPNYIEVHSGFFGDHVGRWGAGLWTFNDRGTRKTGSFTAVTDPPNVFQAQVRAYTGPELSASEPDDTLLRISNSTGYDGDQSVTPEKPFTTPLWTYNNQLYIGDSSGDWQNRAVVLVGGFFSNQKPARVTGTLGLYDGLYSFARSAPGGGVIPNTPFIGTDDGIVDFQGLSFIVQGLPLGYDQENATVIISGTGLYDGTYTGCHVFEFLGFGGIIEGGAMDDVWYAGDVFTGTYEVTTGQTISGNIQQSAGDGPNLFTSAEPEKSGSFTETECNGIRVIVGNGHGILVDDYFEMFSNAVYTSLCFGTVDAVGLDYIDLEFITFSGDDSGLWNATEPIP